MTTSTGAQRPAGRSSYWRGIAWPASIVVVLAALVAGFAGFRGEAVEEAASTSVREGEFAVRSVYNGKVESRNVVTIMSQFNGTATVVELAEEGAAVSRDDLLVRFDTAQLEGDLVKLEKEHELAKSELESLVQAKLPLELRELEAQLTELKASLAAESAYLADSLTLQKEDLISIQEVKDQERKVQRLESELETLELENELTRKYLHPAAVSSARTKAHSARQALELARRQLAATEVRAPTEGVVVYKPLHVGGEFRTVRVGDKIYPNQPFMVIPDMNDLVVHLDVPESELSHVLAGREAFIRPLAYPDLTLPGTVQTVGSVAQALPGHPNWQKFFQVRISVDEIDPLIRPGMSVTTHVVSHYRETAVLIPRRAVSWDQGRALTRIVNGGSYLTRQLTLGPANDTHYEVLSGVEPGEEVLLQ
jgi:multidrug resistance efflux pump